MKEEQFLNKSYKVIQAWKIGNTKMKIGDILTVVDYGAGMACNYLRFKNARLPKWTFKTGTWLFESQTELLS